MERLQKRITTHNVGSKTNLELVLDLDETVVHTFSSSNFNYRGHVLDLGQIVEATPRYQHLRDRIYYVTILDCGVPAGTGNNFKMWGIIRPYTDVFLDWAFGYFKTVSVYSAGKKEYVPIIVNHCFGSWQNQLKAIFNYDQVDRLGGVSYKPLARLSDHGVDSKAALIIDDQEPAVRSNGNRGIIIPVYKPSLKNLDQPDVVLLAIIEWFLNRPQMNKEQAILPSKQDLDDINTDLMNDQQRINDIIRRVYNG